MKNRLWRRLLPRYRTLICPEGRVASFRCLGYGWDSVRSSKGYLFIQWGRALPLKFFLKLPREDRTLPVFLLSRKWLRLYSRAGIVAGKTLRPLDINGYWRATTWRT